MSKLAVLIALLVLVSCGEDRYTSARIHDIEADLWGVKDSVEQRVFIQDTSKLYQASIFVSTTDDGVSAITLLSNIYYKESCLKADTLNIYLSPDLPRTLIAMERKNRFLIMDSIKFNSVGEYRFRFSPTQNLKISAFGVYIYESDMN